MKTGALGSKSGIMEAMPRAEHSPVAVIGPTRRASFAEMCIRDSFSKVHKEYKTPYVSTWLAGLAVGIPAGIMDIDFFADLANIGTLFAFVFVSCAVIILRRTQPDRARSFKVPFCPVTPILSVVCCLGLMLGLPLLAWLGFFAVSYTHLDVYKRQKIW